MSCCVVSGPAQSRHISLLRTKGSDFSETTVSDGSIRILKSLGNHLMFPKGCSLLHQTKHLILFYSSSSSFW